MEQKPHSVAAGQPEALEQHIAAQREQLGANIEELGSQLGGTIHGAGEKIGGAADRARDTADRAREAADWRTWVRKRPLLMVALAFGGGFWLAFRGR